MAGDVLLVGSNILKVVYLAFVAVSCFGLLDPVSFSEFLEEGVRLLLLFSERRVE